MCNVENIGLLSRIAKFTAVELYNVARYVVDSENVTHFSCINKPLQTYENVEFIIIIIYKNTGIECHRNDV